MLHEFSADEIAKVKAEYPKLDLVRPGTWEGEIDFDREYREYRIKDTYKVAITAPEGYPAFIPSLREIGGRTQAIAEKYKLTDIRDLHYNTNNRTACVCVKQEEKTKFPPGSDLVHFIEALAIPYLYGLSFYDEQGYWPWGEYSHGAIGLLEYYADDPSEQSKEDIEVIAGTFRDDLNWKRYSKQLRKPSPDKSCPCGKDKPFQKCHADAYRGLLRLNGDLKRLKLNPYKLFNRT